MTSASTSSKAIPSHIHVQDVSLNFQLFRQKSTSMKEVFSSLFKKNSYQKLTEFHALDHLSVKIGHGERVGIVGHNGAGKSTLLKTLCRIYEPTTGRIDVQGKVAPLLEIGAGFSPELSGRQNIYLNGAILGCSIKTLKSVEQDIIDFAELEPFIDTPVKYYSTGMYMRLAFAIATAIRPDILILDELFAGADDDFIRKARIRMQSFIDSASIMVFVSHDMALLAELSTRVIWLDHGRLVADGDPQTIIAQYLQHALAESES
ncbi:ABC transporter ATP-binding protein [Aquirhabdus parva]|uniref:ABC transporter ATP-binding protein n=1 Tax=Aquirhabdus parva TaxID=2283318 RepID=A0A345P8H8_9GAMM|nr:ABC transporter ATP-binding protein [Aquirhabdus parva]AXI03587.1 ABC transporter ATP-binding protein [Aquirhabdus parva]